MVLRVPLLLLLVPLAHSQPTLTIDRNGTSYALIGGGCEDSWCGSDEGRGECREVIVLHRPAHYCQCRLPFTGEVCDETVAVDETRPDSPYSNCSLPIHCAAVYGDGHCNQECDSPSCLYDGYDCLPVPLCPDYCRDLSSNGVCDDRCKGEECQFDSGDCLSEHDLLPGQLLIRLDITVQAFIDVSRLFLFQLSHFLRATVVLSHDSDGPLIWEFSRENGTGSRIRKGENSSLGIEVAVSVSLSNCTSDCLHSLAEAIGQIAQALASQSSPISSAIIVSVSSSHHRPSSSFPPWLAISTFLFLLSVIVGSIQLRRKRKRVLEAPVWEIPVHGEIPSPARPLKRARVSSPAPTRLHLQAEGIELLAIEEEEDVNARDELGRTPLMMAIQSKRLEADLRQTVGELLMAGADLKAVDANGWGALHHSLAQLRSPNFNRWLVSLGASVLVVDAKGRTAVHLATEYNDLPNLQLLLQTEAVRMIDVADDSNRTPLSIAVSSCTLPLTRCLLDKGADVNWQGEEQFDPSLPRKSPLHLAVELKRRDHLLLLIHRGCRMDSLDHRQRTALHYAVLHADLPICRTVVDAGMPVDAVDDEDRSAEEIARANRRPELEAYLISVRGKNEPWKRKRDRKPKRYSTDQGYGSEESHHQSTLENSSQQPDTGSTQQPSLPIPSFTGRPDWTVLSQMPVFTGPLTPHPLMTTQLGNPCLSDQPPSCHLLSESPSSLMSHSLPPSFLTPN